RGRSVAGWRFPVPVCGRQQADLHRAAEHDPGGLRGPVKLAKNPPKGGFFVARGGGSLFRRIQYGPAAMEPFNKLEGVAAPLNMINVDTDMIIPKQYLKTIQRTGLGKALFDEMRHNPDG